MHIFSPHDLVTCKPEGDSKWQNARTKFGDCIFARLRKFEYLHHQLSIIHTDWKPENVLLLFPWDLTKDPRNSNYTPVEVPRGRETLSMASGVKEKENLGNASGLSKNQKKKVKRRAKRGGFNLDERERN